MTREPLTNASHDVSGMDGFILDTNRLMASELWALATGDEFKAAIGLWCRAWKQTPAGSLPNDDKVLAAFSSAGKNWKKVRDMALRGFVLCSDGRLYHHVLCEDVLRCADAKVKRNERTRAATEARKKQRDVQRDDKRDVEQNPNVTTSHSIAEHSSKIAGLGSAGAHEPLADLERRLREAAGWLSEPAPNLAVTGPIHALIEAGADLDLDVLPVVRSLAPKARKRTSWLYFVDAIKAAQADRIAAAKPLNDPPRRPANVQTPSRSKPPGVIATVLNALAPGHGESDDDFQPHHPGR